MKYYKGWITTPIENYLPRVSKKAIGLTYAGGYTTINDRVIYFPKSQIIIGEPNSAGNAPILIPVWLFKANGLDSRRIREVAFDEVVEEGPRR